MRVSICCRAGQHRAMCPFSHCLLTLDCAGPTCCSEEVPSRSFLEGASRFPPATDGGRPPCVECGSWPAHVNKTGLCNTTTGYLNLGNKGIVSLDPNLFEGMSGVENLMLANNQISFIPSGLFDPLTNLWQLNLGGNQISSLPGGVFDPLNNLEYLKIYRNPLADLRPGVFDHLEHLRVIQMDFLSLTSLSSGIFQALRNLRSLNLAGNQVSMLPDDIFNASSSLADLVLNIRINFHLCPQACLPRCRA